MAYTAIDDPEAYFQVKAYSGTGSSNAQTFDGDTDMQPDLVWIKNREQTLNWMMFDAVRGTTQYFYSNLDEAEGTNDPATILTAFGSDGFTVGANNNVNQSSNDIVAYCWKESATSGFDIVSYTGNETNRTISHSLSAVPKMIIQKNRPTSGGYRWNVYHASNTSAPETDVLVLDEDSATEDSAIYWNDQQPTSSVFSLGTAGQTNKDGATNIAYLFAEKQGFSKFGSYTGNGGSSGVNTADGTYVYTGFRPAWVMIKRTDSAQQWGIGDTKRDTYNPVSHHVFAESNQADADSAYNNFDILSNGFKCRSGDQWSNADGGTFVYIAFAEAPFVNSEGVPCNAR